MLGTPYTGRLPTTQANINLMISRIAKVKQDIQLLDMMVAQGRIDRREAGYRRQQYTGEIYDLERTIRSSRLSTPSYKVPRDLQVFRAQKPANKMISESNNDGLPEGYFGTDTGGNHSSIPSDWEPTTLMYFDVPDVPVQTGTAVTWPSHWPGLHSPLIMQAVMDAGQVNGLRVVDPRVSGFPVTLQPLNAANIEKVIMVSGKYRELQEIIKINPVFTPSDGTLVARIISAIDTTLASAGAAPTLAETTTTDFDENGKFTDKAFERIIDDILRVDGMVMMSYKPYTGWEYTPEATERGVQITKSLLDNLVLANAQQKTLRDDQAKTINDAIRYINNLPLSKYVSSGNASLAPAGTGVLNVIAAPIPGTPDKAEILVDGVPKLQARWKVRPRDGGQYFKFTVNYISTGKWAMSYSTPTFPKSMYGQPQQYHYDELVEAIKQEVYTGMDQINGYKRSARNNRRVGTLMGFGAMQAHDRNRALRADSYVDKATYNQTLREMSMSRARSGARVDITKQIKETPITKPWTLQVSLSPEKISELNMLIDSALMQVNLTQAMFTQQAHNYVASIINSLSSDMSPTQQTEYVVERIMGEMVNRSALLRKDIRVDIDPNNMGVRFESQQEQNIEGLGSALLKTKAAMGRLLG